jgi:hypothetical protein
MRNSKCLVPSAKCLVRSGDMQFLSTGHWALGTAVPCA